MRRVYRPTLVVRVLLGVLGVVLLVLGLFILTVASFADGGPTERAVTVAIAVAVLVLSSLQLYLLRARLTADDVGVDVVNYSSRRRFRWDEIDRFEVGFAYFGVSLVPRTGAPLRVNAIQKPNLLHWLGRRGRADRIVDELNALLAERRRPAIPAPPSEPFLPEKD